MPTVYIYLLQSSLRAERGNVRANVAVGLCRHLFQVHVIVQLHVLSVDPQDLQSTCMYGVGRRGTRCVREVGVVHMLVRRYYTTMLTAQILVSRD